MITFALSALAVVIMIGVTVHFSIGWYRAERRANTAEKAYGELSAQSECREQHLRDELNRSDARVTLQVQALAKTSTRLLEAQQVADLLAPIVRQYAKDLEETAALLKDEKPPTVIAECKSALELYDSHAQLRNQP